MTKGLKVSLEGIDGVGKTTQIPVVQDYLQQRGHEVYYKPCRNNYISNGVDNDILHLLKGSAPVFKEVPAADILLSAARSMVIHYAGIKRHMESGGVVLCDRDVDTGLAYTMPALKERHPDKTTAELTKWAIGVYALEDMMPGVTIWLDADPSVAMDRALSDEVPNQRAIFNDDGVAFIKKVRESYGELHSLYPERIRRVEVGQLSVAQVSDQICNELDSFFAAERAEATYERY